MTRPVIVVDSREQRPLEFTLPTERGTLQTGDYSIRGLEHFVAIERKSVNDLVNCLMGKQRERFERELSRGRGLDYFALVIEAESGRTGGGPVPQSKMNPKAVCQSLMAFSVRYNLPVFFCPGREYAARVIESLLLKYVAEQERRFKAVVHGAEQPQEATKPPDPYPQPKGQAKTQPSGELKMAKGVNKVICWAGWG
jgi:DNA excision repair protein ERCC-4